MRDPYLFSDYDILKNNYNIKDQSILDCMEAEFASTRLREIAELPINGNFNFEHLQAIHRYMYQDLFEWAGRQRILNIEKEEPALGGLSVKYSDVFEIARDGSSAIKIMTEKQWKNMNINKLVKEFSECMSDIWKVHPFREGNTRTIVTFCCQFIESEGIYIDANVFKDNITYLRRALVAANAVFDDLGDLRKPKYLQKIVEDALEKGNKLKSKICEDLDSSGFQPKNSLIYNIVQIGRYFNKNISVNEIKELYMDMTSIKDNPIKERLKETAIEYLSQEKKSKSREH